MQQTARLRPSRARRAAAVVGAGIAALAVGLPAASAKEIGSGGGGGGTAVCSPVSSLTVKADPRVGELGFASIAVSYGVKPCIANQAVTVRTDVYEWANPAVSLWSDPAAALNGKFTVNGVRVRVTYAVKVSVFDAATGALAGSQIATTAAIPKGV